MYDLIFFYSSINRGGSELALLRYLKNTTKKENTLVVYYKDTSDLEMIKEFQNVVEVKKLEPDEVVSTKNVVNCMISTTESTIFDKVKAEKYILWVQVNPEFYSNYRDFEKYDSFLTTSEYIKGITLKHESVKGKKVFLANPIVDMEEIRQKGEESQDVLSDDEINIVSIARVCKNKGYDYMVEIANRLKKRNIDFKWYMLGFISYRDEEYYKSLLEKIENYDLKDNIIFMGAHENPYKFLKHAYMSVLLSNDEAWGLAVTESKALAVPPIASNNSGLKEQIVSGENGYLVDLPETEEEYEAIVDMMQELINNKELYSQMVENLRGIKDNVPEIVKTMDECFHQ
ncbi:MAG: glycosyltransferase [Clostridia bacterium]|nr:glycosyltransferase [Clostridia bacterium]